jgi:uridine phosphorylase
VALIERQVALAAAVTAAALSPEARKALRQGAVYGLAGAMKAGDVVVSAAKGAARGAQEAFAREPEPAAPPPKRRTRSTRART